MVITISLCNNKEFGKGNLQRKIMDFWNCKVHIL